MRSTSTLFLMPLRSLTVAALGLALLAGPALGQGSAGALITIGSGSGAPGQPVSLSIQTTTAAANVAALDLEVRLSASGGGPAPAPSFAAGAQASRWLTYAVPGDPWRFIVYNAIGVSGPAELMRLTVQIPANAPAGTVYTLTAGGMEIAHDDGTAMDAPDMVAAGAVTVSGSSAGGAPGTALPQSDDFSQGLAPFWKAKQPIDASMLPAPTYQAGNGSLTLRSANVDLWASTWEPYFIYQDGITSDFTVQVEVLSVPNCSPYSGVGLMVAQGMPDNISDPSQIPTWWMVQTTSGFGTEVKGGGQGRSWSVHTPDNPQPPYWLRVDRRGGTLTFLRSTDGAANWSSVGDPVSLANGMVAPLSGPVAVGLVMQAHCGSTVASSVVAHFQAGSMSQAGHLPGESTVPTMTSGLVAMAVRGTDNNVYIDTLDPAAGWSGFTPVPGGTTPSAPALAADSAQLSVAVRGTDDGIWVAQRAVAGGGWSGWQPVPGGITSDSPALASIQGRLIVMVRGTYDSIWYNVQTSPGVWSGAWHPLPGSTPSPPALVAFNGTLMAFVRGSDNAIYSSQLADPSNSDSWTPFQAVPGGGLTPNTPRPVAMGARLGLFVRGTDNLLYQNVMDGGLWSGWSSLAAGGSTVTTPAAAYSNSSLLLGVAGTDCANGACGIWANRSDAALQQWQGWSELPGATVDAPVLAATP